MFNRNELFKLMNELLMKDLKNIYDYCGNQYEIYQFDQNLQVRLTASRRWAVIA